MMPALFRSLTAITGRVTPLTGFALAAILLEGIVLVFNGWRCPLRTYAEDIGAVSGQVTDIFLPKWFADRIFLICGSLFGLSVIALVVRFLAPALASR